MTPEQQLALREVTADTTAAQAMTARALSRANSGGAHGAADVARGPLADALKALRQASEMLRKEGMNG